MAQKKPRLRFLASRMTRTVYHTHDRVVIWRGQFCGESGFVVTAVGKKMHVRLENPSEMAQRWMVGGRVVVFNPSCCFVA